MTSEAKSDPEPCVGEHGVMVIETLVTYDDESKKVQARCKSCGTVTFVGVTDKDGRPVLHG
ncbi:MAG: hypothetical protein GTO63_31420 [Anaerolineae bacterium]|nr:hypothetical protein [Anaerolineae bacterium]NIN99202.1 hypothetical protein [Anaerolineae bacterium]NIQ82043.1 hypothetical protein [Anaerolineae bacterium]